MIKQKKVAKALGIQQSYLAKIENEKANPGYKLVCNIIELYKSIEKKEKLLQNIVQEVCFQ